MAARPAKGPSSGRREENGTAPVPPLPTLAPRDRGQQDECFVGGQPRLTQLTQPVRAQIGITPTFGFRLLRSGSQPQHALQGLLPNRGFQRSHSERRHVYGFDS